MLLVYAISMQDIAICVHKLLFNLTTRCILATTSVCGNIFSSRWREITKAVSMRQVDMLAWRWAA